MKKVVNKKKNKNIYNSNKWITDKIKFSYLNDLLPQTATNIYIHIPISTTCNAVFRRIQYIQAYRFPNGINIKTNDLSFTK